jgi:threonine dehydratase
MPASFPQIDIAAAWSRIRDVVRETPLVPFPSGDERIELRLKLECLQEIGAFKARGAWNQVAQLTPAQRAGGVVCSSSGNHGQALAWAAKRAGVHAVIVMPASSYPNKIEACRSHGAEVVLMPTRASCEDEVARHVAAGRTLVHPYDAERTIEGAGTCGLEIAQQWPEVEAVLVPVGGGGLVSGIALALRRTYGERVLVVGVEPAGAPTLSLGIAAGKPVAPQINTQVQGLCPPASGQWNIDIARACVDQIVLLDDPTIFAAQERLVNDGGWVVEPAGAAAAAAVFSGRWAAELAPDRLTGRSAANPLRVVAVVSGGNPDPAQLASVRARAARGTASATDAAASATGAANAHRAASGPSAQSAASTTRAAGASGVAGATGAANAAGAATAEGARRAQGRA